MKTRVVVSLAALLAGAYLVYLALISPASPYLAGGDLSWWVHPEPVSEYGATGPFSLEFRFQPTRAGRLRIAAMSSFRLFQDGKQIPASGLVPASWKSPVEFVVDAGPVRVTATDPRLQPTLGLGGEAAPTRVEVIRASATAAAVPAASLYEVPTRLTDRAYLVARLALGMLILGICVLALRPARSRPTTTPGPTMVVLALAVHVTLVAWNLSSYPAERGLDAEGHQEAAALVLAEHRVPSPDRGWQTYHPPLYPTVGAGAVAVAGSPFGLQLLSTLSAFLMLLIIAQTLGARGWRGLCLAAFAPVLLVTEVQATNEVVFALLATALIAYASRTVAEPRIAIGVGLIGAATLLTKYSALPFLAATCAGLLLGTGSRRGRLRAVALILVVAGLAGAWPYVERYQQFGNPLIGNWNDELGHPYRQGPGFRTAGYFFDVGASLFSHPFRSRHASLWDSLYVSAVSDGFGRFITTDAQHALTGVLIWVALPLAITVAIGLFAAVFDRRRTTLELISALSVLFSVTAMVRFNLLLPYWSTAKAVFLLGLLLPVSVGFERGRSFLLRRGGAVTELLLDANLLIFVLASIGCLVYR